MHKKKKIKASLYCLEILILSLVPTTTLLTIAVHNLTKEVSVWTASLNSLLAFLFLLNLGLVCPIYLTKQLINPLEKLNVASEKLAHNEFDVDLEYKGNIKELNNAFNNFQTMCEELSSVETMRFDFVSNVSHEFKTPLAAIEGCVAVLQNDELTKEEKDEYLQRIILSTKCLSSLVNNILMLNKLENLTTKPEISTYRLDDQILQILLQQETVWNKKDIYFDLHLDEITYTGPKDLMYHVWSNLISNAVKYSHEHGKIVISLQYINNEILFTITDNGIGMSDKDMRHIFEKFYQADTMHKKDGNGLGLAQVKKILDITGNTISVESKKKQGSSFIVHITH